MAKKQKSDGAIGYLGTIFVAIGFVIYSVVESLTDFQDQLSLTVNVIIGCSYGIAVGLLSRYSMKAVLRARRKQDNRVDQNA